MNTLTNGMESQAVGGDASTYAASVVLDMDERGNYYTRIKVHAPQPY